MPSYLKVAPCIIVYMYSIFGQCSFFLNYFRVPWRKSAFKCNICFHHKDDFGPQSNSQIVFLLYPGNALVMLSDLWITYLKECNSSGSPLFWTYMWWQLSHWLQLLLEGVVNLSFTFEWALLHICINISNGYFFLPHSTLRLYASTKNSVNNQCDNDFSWLTLMWRVSFTLCWITIGLLLTSFYIFVRLRE